MSQEFFARIMFTNKCLKAKGQAFEDLFNQVMILRNNDFRKVAAYGNIGDRKNDGFLPSTGTYYQVFAPANLNSTRTSANAVTKLDEDFNKLYQSWNDTIPIKSFKYVLNDKQEGTPPQVELKMGELRNSFSTIGFSTYTLDDLIAEFDLLSIEHKQDIIGFIPSTNQLTTVSVPAITNTINHLKERLHEVPKPNEDFNQIEYLEKINFNYLPVNVSDLMLKAETQIYLLEEYFKMHDNKSLRDLLKNYYSYTYETQKSEYGEINDINSSLIFFRLLDETAYDKSKEAQNASLILISYFFISCDIYEKPIADV